MAITEAHPGIKVDIRVGGVPLTEYDDDDEQAQTSEKTVTKYIEATSGAEFAVNCEVTRPLPKHSLLVDVFLDGQRKRGTYMDKPGITSRISIEGCNYTERQRWFLQKFCFSGLDTVDSTESTVPDKLMNGLKSVGNIRVEVFHVMNLRDVTERTKLPERQDAIALGKVPEKALKGRTLSHHATLSPAVASQGQKFSECDHVDPMKLPMAVFNFKYRSRAALQSLLIIPRSPSPVPLEERDINSLTAEESRELIRRLRERDEAAPRLKREGVKRERSNTVSQFEDYSEEVTFVSEKRRRLPITVNEDCTETIDLT